MQWQSTQWQSTGRERCRCLVWMVSARSWPLIERRPRAMFGEMLAGAQEAPFSLFATGGQDALADAFAVGLMPASASLFMLAGGGHKLIVAGGCGEIEFDGFYFQWGTQRAGQTAVLQLDFSTKQWSRLADMPEPRVMALGGVIDGKMIVAGGCNRGTSVQYGFSSDGWTKLANLPMKQHSMVGSSSVVHGKFPKLKVQLLQQRRAGRQAGDTCHHPSYWRVRPRTNRAPSRRDPVRLWH